jgi:molecular chaperone HtpG
MSKKQHNFEAETGRILELLTHSIYSNKEIFLRELISNSADAIDKARLKALTDTSFLKEGEEFQITLDFDTEKNPITLRDNGIGMTESELIKNLGTIAKSGTKEFIEKLKAAKETTDHNLIGQF